MKKFFDAEICMYLVVGVVMLIIASVLNRHQNNTCIDKGGQVVHNNGKIGDLCILPIGKK
jgi:hypothetical protein